MSRWITVSYRRERSPMRFSRVIYLLSALKASRPTTGYPAGDVKPYTEILEWSLPVNSYGQILTLLYDEEGIAGWDEDDDVDEGAEVEWEPPAFHKGKRKR